MDFKRLRYFSGVSEAGSFTAAAAQMSISQPSLSRQISLLEEELGVKLFERQRRGVVLTQEGEKFFSRIRVPLAEIDEALRDVRSSTGKRKPKITLYIPPTEAAILASSLTRRFAALTSEMSLRIAEGATGTIANMLRRNELDAAIVYGPAETLDRFDWWHLIPAATTLDLLEEEMVLVGPASSDLSAGRKISVEALAAFPLIFPSRPNLPVIFRHLMQEMAERCGRHADDFQESDSMQQLKEMASAGMGYPIVPLSSILSEVHQGILRYAPIDSPNARRRLTLVSRQDSPFPAALTKTIAILQEEIAALVTGGAWPAKLLY